MVDDYRIFGSEVSPYSVKVRSYFRYKGIPHRWIPRSSAVQAEYDKYAKVPIIPLVVTPDGQGIQDSTPLIEHIDSLHPEPSIHPADTVTRFMSALIEEFGDEWGNKWMFHYRWERDIDQRCSAGRIARMREPDADDAQHTRLADQVRERMSNRVWFVGSNAVTAPQIEAGFREAIALLESHLATRPYLFGARPAFGDFALWAQLYECWTDPTPCALIEGCAPNVLAWIQRMLWPSAQGEFEAWADLEPTLLSFLQRQVGQRFMPWTLANEQAVAGSQEEFSVTLLGQTWTQKPQKYHAKSLGTLRARFKAVDDHAALDAVLDQVGCLAGLRG